MSKKDKENENRNTKGAAGDTAPLNGQDADYQPVSGQGSAWQQANGQQNAAQTAAGQQAERPTNEKQPWYGYQNPYQNNWQNQQSQRYYGDYYQGNASQGDRYQKNPIWKKVLLIACLCVLFVFCGGLGFLAMQIITGASMRSAQEAIAEAGTPAGGPESGAAADQNTAGKTQGDGNIPDENRTGANPQGQQRNKTGGDAPGESEAGDNGAGGNAVYGNLTDVSEIVERIMPSVVSVNGVYTYTENYWGESYSEQYDGGGSGFIIGQNEEELLIATNSHVVADVEDLKVTFHDETSADARIKGYDNDLDVAVLAVDMKDIAADTKASVAVAKLGDSTLLKAGQAVISIGNALLMGQSVTTGVVSAVNMPVGGGYDEMGNQYGSDDRVMIQTTAFMNPGCSGGVLINAAGEVIGINTMTISSDMVEGMCYAIPISDAIPVLDRLKEKKTREKLPEKDSGYLGISCTNVGKQEEENYGMPIGVYINEVYDGSGAQEAGLQKGDVIVSLDGDSVKKIEQLQEMLRYYAAGESVEVEIMRYNSGDYQSRIIEVKLGKR